MLFVTKNSKKIFGFWAFPYLHIPKIYIQRNETEIKPFQTFGGFTWIPSAMF